MFKVGSTSKSVLEGVNIATIVSLTVGSPSTGVDKAKRDNASVSIFSPHSVSDFSRTLQK